MVTFTTCILKLSYTTLGRKTIKPHTVFFPQSFQKTQDIVPNHDCFLLNFFKNHPNILRYVLWHTEDILFLFLSLKNSLPSSTYIRYEIPATFSQVPSYILLALSFSIVRYVAGIIHIQRPSTMLLTLNWISHLCYSLIVWITKLYLRLETPFNRRI